MNEKGSATILALLISAVLITVGIGFNWIVKEHLKAAEGLKAKAEAMIEARSTFDDLIYSILRGQLTQKDIVFSGGQSFLGMKQISLGSAGVQLENGIVVRIQDSSSLISLLNPDIDVLKRLIVLAGGTMDTANAITDSYLDWIDPDDLSRVNGAESTFYRLQGKPYGPRNYPIQYKDEMAFVKGMDPQLYAKLEPYLTVLPSLGFNPNTADDIMLMAYLDIGQEALDKLKSYRAQKPLSSDIEILGLTGKTIRHDREGIYFFPSPFFAITVQVGSPRSLYTVSTGVDIRPTASSPYSVVYWKEG